MGEAKHRKSMYLLKGIYTEMSCWTPKICMFPHKKKVCVGRQMVAFTYIVRLSLTSYTSYIRHELGGGCICVSRCIRKETPI